MASPSTYKILVAIDFQNIFNDAKSPWNVTGFDKALDEACKLFNKSFNLIIFTTYLPPNSNHPIWKSYLDSFPDIPRDEGHSLYHTDKKLLDRLKSQLSISHPTPIEHIFTHQFGKWNAIKEQVPSFHNILNNSLIELYVTGVATECCVLSTVLAAVDDGVKVYIAKDACAGPEHEKALQILSGFAPSVVIDTVDNFLYSRSYRSSNI